MSCRQIITAIRIAGSVSAQALPCKEIKGTANRPSTACISHQLFSTPRNAGARMSKATVLVSWDSSVVCPKNICCFDCWCCAWNKEEEQTIGLKISRCALNQTHFYMDTISGTTAPLNAWFSLIMFTSKPLHLGSFHLKSHLKRAYPPETQLLTRALFLPL